MEFQDFEENTETEQEVNYNYGGEGNLLNLLKSNHKSEMKGYYFDEDYFQDLVFNKYLPTVKRNQDGKIISRDIVVEKEILAQILLVVNAIINKYGIWRFAPRDILQNEGIAECWKSLFAFDPEKGHSFFHYFSLIVKFHLINLTKKDKDAREAADIDICPELESRSYVENNSFYTDFESCLFDIIETNFQDKKQEYFDLASVFIEYINERHAIIGKND